MLVDEVENLGRIIITIRTIQKFSFLDVVAYLKLKKKLMNILLNNCC